MLMSYTFRGVQIDVDITQRTEPFEWNFYGVDAHDYDALKVTADEEMAIAEAIGQFLYEKSAHKYHEH